MIKKGKLRNLLLLKFFSLKAKVFLACALVFVLAAVIIFKNYTAVKADNILYSEDFTATTYKDAAATTAKWDTSGTLSRLWGKEWTNLAQTQNGYEQISNILGSTSISNMVIKVGSNNIPYVVWMEGIAGPEEIFFTKWTPGAGSGVCGGSLTDCWTNMAGTVAGPENISQTAAISSDPKLVLDSNNNPFIVWQEQHNIAWFTKWTPSAAAWTKMDSTTVPTSYDILPLSFGYYPDIALDSNNYPYIVAVDSSWVYFTRWNGIRWGTMKNVLGSEHISNTGGLHPLIKISKSSVADYNDNPNVIYAIGQDLYFIRWKKGDDGTVCGPDTACWTNFAGDTPGQENVSNTNRLPIKTYADFDIELDTSTNPNAPYVVWENYVGAFLSEIYFSKGSLGPGICGAGIDGCWTQMNGTTAPSYDNVSNTPGFDSPRPQLELDSVKNPYITWYDYATGNHDIYFTKWTPGTGWTRMNGAVLPNSYDNLSGNGTASEYPILQIDQFNNNAYVIWNDAGIYVSKGVPGTGWTKIDGTVGPPAYDNLSGVAAFPPVMVLGDDRNLYAVWPQSVAGNVDMMFTKILPDYDSPEIIQSANVNSGTDFIKGVTLTANQTINPGTSISYSLSNDGGTTWESATSGIWHDFTSVGNDLRWKASLATSDLNQTSVINDLSIASQTYKMYCSLTPNDLTLGDTLTISAKTSFTPVQVWATIENEATSLNNTVNLGTSSCVAPYDHCFSVLADYSYLGHNEVAVFAKDSFGQVSVCNPSTGANWQSKSAYDIPWSPRVYHEALSYNNKVYVMGGLSDKFNPDVWSSADGLNWTLETNDAFGTGTGRGMFGSVVYNGKMWIMGGRYFVYDAGPITQYDDAYSSTDGKTWTQEITGAPWGKRSFFGATVFNGKIWIAGGLVTGPGLVNDVWSFDGTNWTQKTAAAAWSARGGQSLVAYNGKLWLMGGNDGVNLLNDVWSSPDGITWTQQTASAGWADRTQFKVAVYNDGTGDKMWLTGGGGAGATPIVYNDVYSSSDGINWTLVSDPADHYPVDVAPGSQTYWSARRAMATVVHNFGTGNKLAVIGGYEYKVGSWSDVWTSSDGVTWDMLNDNYGAPFGKRFNTELVNFNNELWLLGGDQRNYSPMNDIWSSTNGENWVRRSVNNNPAVWSPRFGHETYIFNNELWVIGGCKGLTTVAGGRCEGLCVGGVNAGLFCASGADCPGSICQTANLRDAWKSADGVNWTQVTAASEFAGRYEAASVVYNNKMWLMGGYIPGICTPASPYSGSKCFFHSQCGAGGVCSSVCLSGPNSGLACTIDANCTVGLAVHKCGSYGMVNDVIWTTNGINWTQETGSASWPVRGWMGATTYDDGTGEKIYIMGGQGTGAIYYNDVWYTTNGSSWTQATASAAWSKRLTMGVLNYDDKMWVITGQQDAGGLLPALWARDVWWSKDGANWTQETATTEFYGRDFPSFTVFNNQMWMTGGDTNFGTMEDIWASKFDYSDMYFDVARSSIPGGTAIPPSPPSNLACEATANNAIKWTYNDNSGNENGFRLYEPGSVPVSKVVVAENITEINENNLPTNIKQTRYVVAFNGDGESSASDTVSCFSLAKVPGTPLLGEVGADYITVALVPNDGNPGATEYAIYEGISNQYVQDNGQFGPNEKWLTYEQWGSAAGIKVVGGQYVAQMKMALDTGQSYNFMAKARNGDGISTTFSGGTAGTPPEGAINIVASKAVGINLAMGGMINSVIGKAVFAQWQEAGQTSQGVRLFQELSIFLNIVLLILLVIIVVSIFESFKRLAVSGFGKKMQIIKNLLLKEAHEIFGQHARADQRGTYKQSYHDYKKIHDSSQQTMKRALAVLGFKILILLGLIIWISQLNHSIKAQEEYDKDGTEVREGDVISYQISFNNQGTDTATAVIVEDILDADLEYVAGSGIINVGGTDKTEGISESNNVVSFVIGDLASGASGYVRLSGRVKIDTGGNNVRNQGEINGDNFSTVTTNITNNQVVETVASPTPALSPTASPSPSPQPSPTESPVPSPTASPTQSPVPTPTASPSPSPQPSPTQSPVFSPVPSPEQSPVTSPTPPEEPGIIERIPMIGPVVQVIEQTKTYQFLAEKFFNNPKVEKASQNVVTPLLLLAAILNTIPTALLIVSHLLVYLHLLFIEPLLYFFKKKREKWGIVYNALTKIPVDLAIIRLYSEKDRKLLQTRITDKNGRYLLNAKEAGRYYLSVEKPGYVYPTMYLNDDLQDIKYLDIYHGEVVEVKEENTNITANIPLDPAEQKSVPVNVAIRAYLIENLRLMVSYIGIILAVLVVIIVPTILTVGALIFHLILFLVFRRLVVPPKPKSWGIIYDQTTKLPLGQSVVRIFDLRFNKLLETQVADRRGKYAFLVGKNQYQVLAEKEGYKEEKIAPVDLVKQDEIIDLDIGLQKK